MASPSPDHQPLSEWVERDYYRRPRLLRRLRRGVSWATVGVVIIGVGLALGFGKRTLYQAAPVSPAHALFNDSCNQCHTEAFATATNLWRDSAGHHSVPNQACTHCHAGAIHNSQQTHQPACASCHAEHRGRPLLAQVPSGHCTACHADVHRLDGQPSQFRNVSDFHRGHPEFALWRDRPPEDPGRLHFNHQVHLNSNGLANRDGRIEHLACASCHQPDAAKQNLSPINFDAHCARCHTLSVQIVGSWTDPNARAVAERFRNQAAPHRPPTEIRAALRERLTEAVQAAPGLLVNEKSEPTDRLLPGRLQAAPPSAAPDARAWVDRQLRDNERLLFASAGGCRYCHVSKEEAASRPRPDDLPEWEPTNLPRTWLPHARFHHETHRLLSCTECHAATGSRQTRDVLIPRIGTCQACHNPQAGVRSGCIDCHRYHDRSHETDWSGRLTLDQLRGGHREK